MAQVLTDGDDYIVSATDATVYALDGADIVKSGQPNAEIYGDRDSDFIGYIGGSNAAKLYGGPGDDTLHGDDGADEIYGGRGNDLLLGHQVDWIDLNAGTITDTSSVADNDVLFGGDGHDALFGFAGDDKLFGGDGFEGGSVPVVLRVRTEDGTITIFDTGIYGGAGDDELYGGSSPDKLFGGADDDKLFSGSGNDTLYGGGGDDIFFGTGDALYFFVDNNTYFGGAGNDTAYSGYSPYESMTFYGGVGDDTAIGTSQADYIAGDDGGDFLWGADGDDAVVGGAGNDHIVGYFGSDTLIGGAGTDAFNFYYDINTAANDFDYVADFTFGEDYVLFSQTVANDVIFFDYGGVAYAYIPDAAGEAHTIGFDGGATAAQVQASTFFI